MAAVREGSASRPGPPLTVWRICKEKHAAFDGEGARLNGGRWNRPGAAVVYTAESQSLCASEFFVHLDTDLEPEDLVSISAVIPAVVAIEEVAVDGLPVDWRSYPGPDSLRQVGDEWLRRARSAVLSVPSALFPSERNHLVNPRHPAFAEIEVRDPEPFAFDPRMWK